MRLKIAFFIGFIFFVACLVTLPHYGINWDTINHLPRGQAYLNYFLSGSRDYSNLDEESPEFNWYWQDPDSLFIKTDIPRDQVPRRSMYQSYATEFSHFMLHDGGGHPPLSDIISSAFNRVLFGQLRLINDIDSYRVYGVFLAACLLGLIYWWTSKLYGFFAGLVAAASLSLYPLFWAESHFNTEKDIPETVYWSFFLFSVWMGITKKSWKWIILSGIFFGLALGTKFNILFAIFVIIPWLLIALFRRYKNYLYLISSGLLAFIIGTAIFIGSWPYLWADLIGRLGKVFGFYKEIGIEDGVGGDILRFIKINPFVIKWISFTTPIIILMLFLIGVIAVVTRLFQEKHKTSLLFLLWFIVPVARTSWYGASVYGGARQLMEYIPAMAILAGLGASFLIKIIGSKLLKALTLLFIIINFAFLTFNLIKIHPNENVYFNQIIGGLRGAKEKGILFWGFSFGSPYRQAVSFINKHAEPNSKVVFVYDLIPNISRIWLRSDLVLHNSNRSGFLQKGEYAMAVIYQGTENRSYYDMYLERFVNPIYEVKVDGVAILKVWKNSEEYLKVNWDEKLTPDVKFKELDFGLRFDLGENKKLSRLEVEFGQDNCTPMTSGYVRVSQDSEKWEILPGGLPDDWRVSSLGEQPGEGVFIEPFVGQIARFVDVIISPKDACLRNIENFRLYYFIDKP